MKIYSDCRLFRYSGDWHQRQSFEQTQTDVLGFFSTWKRLRHIQMKQNPYPQHMKSSVVPQAQCLNNQMTASCRSDSALGQPFLCWCWRPPVSDAPTQGTSCCGTARVSTC